MGKSEHIFRSDRLRELQGQQSQIDFARFLEINQSQLQKYLSGRSDPSAAVIAKICTKTGVSSDWLLGLSSDKHGQMLPLSSQEVALLEAVKNGLNIEALQALLRFLKGGDE